MAIEGNIQPSTCGEERGSSFDGVCGPESDQRSTNLGLIKR